MAIINEEALRHKDEKLPLAVLIHYNVYFSLIFGTLTGRFVFEKTRHFEFDTEFQRDLLVPVFLVWWLAELPRLYVGQKGVLRDKLPEIAAFLLLSLFPQIWIVIYLAFLQEFVFTFDRVLGVTMLMAILAESCLSWRLLRSIIARQSALFRRQNIQQ